MDVEESYAMSPIGYLRTPWEEKFGIPRQPGLVQEAWGVVEFSSGFDGLEAREGLEGFSHLWLTFIFHSVQEEQTRLRVRPPRLGGNEKVGVFATRSPFRPNRIGLSVCEIESVTPELRLRGVDLLDGTPLLDIRPYLPYVDALPEAQAGFAIGPPAKQSVKILKSARDQWDELSEEVQSLVTEMLAHQPQPAYQKDSERIYRARVTGLEVAWRQGESEVLLLEVARATNS